MLSQAKDRSFETRKSYVVTTHSRISDCCPRTRKSSFRIFGMTALLVAVVCFEESQVAAQPQSPKQPQNHTVGARLAIGPADGQLSLVFTVNPAIRVLPTVHSLGVAPGSSKTLTVSSQEGGNYSAVLAETQGLDNGQLLIELSDAASGLQEFHGLDFAMREIAATGPSSSPSRDGHFVVYTKPIGVPPTLAC